MSEDEPGYVHNASLNLLLGVGMFVASPVAISAEPYDSVSHDFAVNHVNS